MNKKEMAQKRTEVIDRTLSLRRGDFLLKDIIDEVNSVIPATYQQVLARLTTLIAQKKFAPCGQVGRAYRYIRVPSQINLLARGFDMSPADVCEWLKAYMEEMSPVSAEELGDLRSKAAEVAEMQASINQLIIQKDAIRALHREEMATLRREFDNYVAAAKERIRQLKKGR